MEKEKNEKEEKEEMKKKKEEEKKNRLAQMERDARNTQMFLKQRTSNTR